MQPVPAASSSNTAYVPVQLSSPTSSTSLKSSFEKVFFFFLKKLVMGCCARAAGGLRAGGRAAPTGSAAARCGIFYGRSTVGPRYMCFSSTDFVFLMVFGTTVGPKLPWTVEAKRVYGMP
jgi:hypothetical protein